MEFMPKIGTYLPVVRCNVAMVTAIIQKLTPKNVSTGKSLREIN